MNHVEKAEPLPLRWDFTNENIGEKEVGYLPSEDAILKIFENGGIPDENKMDFSTQEIEKFYKSGTPGKAGGLKDCEPLKAVEYLSRLKAASHYTKFN